MNVKQSNRWLPLREEMDPEVDPISPTLRVITAERVLLAMKFASTPIFDELQKRQWFDHFADMSYNKLARNCKVLGLPNPHNNPYSIPKAELIDVLVRYYQGRVNP